VIEIVRTRDAGIVEKYTDIAQLIDLSNQDHVLLYRFPYSFTNSILD
jgi:hypothetical protein